MEDLDWLIEETAEEISVTKQGRCIIKPLRVTKKGINQWTNRPKDN